MFDVELYCVVFYGVVCCCFVCCYVVFRCFVDIFVGYVEYGQVVFDGGYFCIGYYFYFKVLVVGVNGVELVLYCVGVYVSQQQGVGVFGVESGGFLVYGMSGKWGLQLFLDIVQFYVFSLEQNNIMVKI